MKKLFEDDLMKRDYYSRPQRELPKEVIVINKKSKIDWLLFYTIIIAIFSAGLFVYEVWIK